MRRSSLPDAATRYAERGLFVFPLAPRDKKPMVAGGRGFLDASSDREVVAHWWHETPDANIGLVPGRSGLVVFDIDGPDGEEAARALGLLDAATLACATGRANGGRHLYFARPDFDVSNAALAPRLDVRGDHGYVVVPPSVHPTGTRYRWTARTWPAPPLPPAALEALQARQASPTRAGSVIPRVLHGDRATSLERRIDAYLSTIGQCAEGGRNNAAFQVSAWLLRDMALPTELAWTHLAAWNAANAPPLTERELRACFASARKHGRRMIGAGRERNRSRPLPRVARPIARATPLTARAQPYIGARVLRPIGRPSGGAE